MPGRVTLGGIGDLFRCSQSFAPSSGQPVPKPMGPSSPAPGTAAMRISAQPGGLESQRLCQSSAECPPRAPPRLLPGRWARAPLIIEQKYCSIPRQPAHLPFFLPNCGAHTDVGVCCCSASARAALQRVPPQLPWGGGFLISKFSPFLSICLFHIDSFSLPFFFPPLLWRGF